MTPEAIRRIDRSGMYDLIRAFPDHWREGRVLARAAELNLSVDGRSQVVVAGMGGSAIGGDLLRALAQDEASVPVSVVRGYRLPASVDARAVVIVSSFSGNTEETLSAMDEALARSAAVVCIASGGTVLERAQADGLPHVQIPGGMPPRAALGYSLSVLLTLAERVGLLHLGEDAWHEAQGLLEDQAEAYAYPSGNHALALAEELVSLMPLVYTASGLLKAVGLRWRGQLQENSKKMAAGNVFPELNHNEIMGWEEEGERLRSFGVVVLRDRDDHPRVQRRMDVTRDLLAGRAGYWTEEAAEGESKLARMLSLVNLGDWVSLYLAALRGVDPTPIGLINRLKETLQG
jgi:glucose/mannose-6-phosphate isomerase